MIYFWEIDQLKSDLATKGLPRRHVWIYLSAILLVLIATEGFSIQILGATNIWDRIDSGIFTIFLILGTTYCYYVNGGPEGKDFADRYISLAWVFGVRYTVLIAIPSALCLLIVLATSVGLTDETVWYEVLFSGLLTLLFYCLLSAHIRDVALNRVSPDKKPYKVSRKHAEDFDQSKYPTILRRYLATLIDGALILLVFVSSAYMLQGNSKIEIAIRIGIGCAIFFGYEPLFTSKLCTLGQKTMGIRIREIDTEANISVIAAYLRIVVKILVGFISFFSIPWTRKRRALHDFVAGSVVVYAK